MFSHPASVCLTYWEHMKFSFYLSYTFFTASFYAFVHGIYPYIYYTFKWYNKNLEDMKKIGCRKNEN